MTPLAPPRHGGGIPCRFFAQCILARNLVSLAHMSAFRAKKVLQNMTLRRYSQATVWAVVAAGALSACSNEAYYCDAAGTANPSCYVCDGVGCRSLAPPSRTACQCDFECGANLNCTALGCTTTCATDANCARGTQCRGGLCLHPSEAAPVDRVCACARNSDCPNSSLVCLNGNCVQPVTPVCSATTPCIGGRVCVSGTCRTPEFVCRFNTECGAGRFCVNQHCVAECSATTPCATGSTCDLAIGRCVENTSSGCTNNASCGDNRVCVDSTCYDACTTDTQCGAGRYCEPAGFCRVDDRPHPSCSTAVPCRDGAVCRNGVCRSPCTQASECPRFDVQLQFCVQSVCATSNEATSDCSAQSECRGATQSCVDGVCR